MAYVSEIENVPPMTIVLANRSTDTTRNKWVIRMEVGEGQFLKCNACYIPTFKINIPSSSRLNEFDKTTKFEKSMCTFYDRRQGGKLIGSTEMNPNDGLYTGRLAVPARSIRLNYTVDQGDVRVDERKTWGALWHDRPAHANTKIIKKVIASRKYRMSSVNRSVGQQCNICVRTEQTKTPANWQRIKEAR